MRCQYTPHAMSWMSHFIHHAQRESTHPLTKERFSLKGARAMHSFARHRTSRASKASATETKGLILKGGWRYDLMEWFIDTFMFRGQVRELRQRTATLVRMQPRDAVLDMVCGTETLAMRD